MTAAFDSEQIETNDEYHADTATISKTMLNEYCKSPVNFNLMFNKGTMERKRPTKVMQVGTIMHAVLLEKKSVSEVCEAYSTDCFKSNGDLNPKPAEAFRESIGGKIAVKSKGLLEIYDCYEAIAASPLYDAIQQSTECEKRHDAVVELVSLWLWDAEHQRRIDSAIRDERRTASFAVGDLPPRQDG